MNLIFLVGTAGSGKSFLTSVFSNWLKLKNQDVVSVNLDPGVLKLPYTPDVDVREYVSLRAIMERHTLGPNGALILASDLIASKITSIRTEVEEYNSDYVLVDTPGQMELFAFRESGIYIADELSSDPKVILYLFDATFSANPLNYVSNMFLATAVQHRFFFPQLYILSKADLLSDQKIEEILSWGSDYLALEDAIETELEGTKRLFSYGLTRLINRLGLSYSLIPVSATKDRGLLPLHAQLTTIFSGGEEAL